MQIKDSIQSQYLASLAMLGEVIEKCPPSLWNAEKDKNRFWHVAYHALFYTHLYLQPSEHDFTPWEKGRPQAHYMGSLPNQPDVEAEVGDPYSREELLAYLAHCRRQVAEILPDLDLEAQSGFHWLPLNKLELQFYNIRHIMLHTGELSERLWVDEGIEAGWVGRG